MSEIEIRDKLKTQGVVEVHRVTVKKEGKVIPTNTLFLTLNRPDVQKEIVVGYLKVKVELFVPNRLRCFNCNKFSLTSQRCRTTAKCQRCGKDKHEEQREGLPDMLKWQTSSCCFWQKLPGLEEGDGDSTQSR